MGADIMIYSLINGPYMAENSPFKISEARNVSTYIYRFPLRTTCLDFYVILAVWFPFMIHVRQRLVTLLEACRRLLGEKNDGFGVKKTMRLQFFMWNVLSHHNFSRHTSD